MIEFEATIILFDTTIVVDTAIEIASCTIVSIKCYPTIVFDAAVEFNTAVIFCR